MTERERLLAELADDSLRDINRLVFAAEAFEAPDLGEVPSWDKSPADVDGFASEDPAELRALAAEWQAWASDLDGILSDYGLLEIEEAASELRAKAKAARAALIRLDVYLPSPPVSP